MISTIDAEEEHASVETMEEDAGHSAPEFYYTDKERFLFLTTSRFDFAEAFLESLLSHKGKGYVFLDFENKVALVEKNYIAKTAMGLIEQKNQRDFEIDFLKKDAAHIFDGALISDMLRSVSIEFDIFLTFGKGKRSIYNLLIEVEDVPGLFINGWFAKIDFKSYDGIDRFIKQRSHGASIKIITSNPKDIGKRSKRIENVKWIY